MLKIFGKRKSLYPRHGLARAMPELVPSNPYSNRFQAWRWNIDIQNINNVNICSALSACITSYHHHIDDIWPFAPIWPPRCPHIDVKQKWRESTLFWEPHKEIVSGLISSPLPKLAGINPETGDEPLKHFHRVIAGKSPVIRNFYPKSMGYYNLQMQLHKLSLKPDPMQLRSRYQCKVIFQLFPL